MSYWTRQLKLVRQEWSRNNAERKDCFAHAKVLPVHPEDLPRWLCEKCDKSFALSEVQCDHIIPLHNTVPQTLDEFIECVKRLHVDIFGLQILCHTCHKFKTKFQANEKMRAHLIDFIEIYIQASLVLESLDTQVLKKIAKAVQGMQKPDERERKKFERKFDTLCKKYL